MSKETKKLYDILKDVTDVRAKEEVNFAQREFDLTQKVKQAKLSVDQDVLNTEALINKQETKILNILKAEVFSPSDLYLARQEKKLLDLKLVGLTEIKEELF